MANYGAPMEESPYHPHHNHYLQITYLLSQMNFAISLGFLRKFEGFSYYFRNQSIQDVQSHFL